MPKIAATFGQTDRGAGKWFSNILVDIPEDILRHLGIRSSFFPADVVPNINGDWFTGMSGDDP